MVLLAFKVITELVLALVVPNQLLPGRPRPFYNLYPQRQGELCRPVTYLTAEPQIGPVLRWIVNCLLGMVDGSLECHFHRRLQGPLQRVLPEGLLFRHSRR